MLRRGTLAAFTVGFVLWACVGEDPDSVTPPVVITQPGGDGGPDTTCPAGQHRCADKCVSNDDVATCGTSCTPCVAPSGGKATCSAGACGITCDAPLTACGQACVDTTKDTNHCARCDRKCGGASTCAGSLCSTETVASGIAGLQEIAATTSKIILLSKTKIQSVAPTGGTPVSIVSDPVVQFDIKERTLSVDLNNVYFGGTSTYQGGADTTAIFKLPLAGGTAPLAIAQFLSLPGASVDGLIAAWFRNGAIQSCEHGGTCPNLSGANPTMFDATDATNPFDVKVSGNAIVWTASTGGPSISGVFTCATSGTAPRATTKLATMQNPERLRIHAGVVYWIDQGGDSANFTPPQSPPAVYACALAGCAGTPARLYTQVDPLGELAVDATGVYVTNPGAKQVLVLRSLTKADQSPEILAKPATKPTAITLDATSVYFAVEGAVNAPFDVLRVAK